MYIFQGTVLGPAAHHVCVQQLINDPLIIRQRKGGLLCCIPAEAVTFDPLLAFLTERFLQQQLQPQIGLCVSRDNPQEYSCPRLIFFPHGDD